ncbi:MAG TPA: helix-turn-helix domain-containing protein [Gammaproteobacteria bacterium]|nr:helix-turn-helix domain-containing protein [Luteimonas sp.]HRO26520.1 helix-turn-helix domain-containing protein [Luteimonas sp.]HRP35074.1 helix-turn-helix domain-containing protein [Gammaproteobacteria bacterium]HRP73643.1 helix-turn-helix domain-containing protein [Luteimonas sp.]
MTASRLQDAALARFARQGFDATSMNEIAADVGIRKPSVYAHFRNKDELFLSLIPQLIEAELEHARTVLVAGGDARQPLLAYLKSIQTRFESSHRVEFWVRMLFAPPYHLHDVVMAPMHAFMDELEGIIRKLLKGSSLVPNAGGLGVEVLTAAYMGMIDSLHSELLFGGAKRYQRRLKASWAVFEAGVAPASG